jgi:hypothetical protein
MPLETRRGASRAALWNIVTRTSGLLNRPCRMVCYRTECLVRDENFLLMSVRCDVPAKIWNRFEVGHEAAHQPDRFQIQNALAFLPARRLHLIATTMQGGLQHRG